MGGKTKPTVVVEREWLRCGHRWLPRQPGRPDECAKCQSPRWDRPKETR